MHLFYKNNSPAQRQGGFTLLEVALALAVISLIMVPYIQVYKQYLSDQIKRESDSYLSVVQSALQKYSARYGRYPMPANPSLGPGAAGFGQEVALATITNCSPGSLDACRTPAAWASPNNVLVGAVPFAALGLPQRYVLDGYKNKFTYAVTERMTVVATYADDGGVIKVVNNAGADTSASGQNVHYVVLSHGRDRKGAFTLDGVQTIACDVSIASRDNENCDNDATFTDNFAFYGISPNQHYLRTQTDVAGPDHYDDYIHWVTTSDTDIWTKTVLAGASDIFNRELGNVRIGAGVEPTAKVEIWGGDLKADALRTTRLCPNSGGCATPTGSAIPQAGVFDPRIIGGTPTATTQSAGGGINCGSNTGMTGIGNSDEECNLASFPTTLSIGAPCSGGMAAHRIVAGALVCVTP